jgi:ribose transport system substrate-binding protein
MADPGRNKLLAAATAAGLVLLAGACGTDATPSAAGNGFTVGMVSVTNCGNPTICAVEKGFSAEVERAGGKAIVLEWDGQGSPVEAAIRNMDQLIAQNVDAIALWPIDAGALKAPTKRAFTKGIPVVAFDDFDVTNEGVIALVTQGRELKAKQAADLFCQRLPTGSKVLYGDYGLPIPSLQFLATKFAEHLKACSNGGITIASTYINKTDDVAGARTAAEPALQANRDVVGVDSYNDPTSVGASQAAEALGLRKNLLILGYNTAPDGVEALKAGRLDYSWDYQPVLSGQLLARTAIEYITGVNKTPPKIIMVWPRCYSAQTIAERPSWDQQIIDIGKGTDLAAGASTYITRGDSVPAIPSTLPGCPA